MGDSGIEYPKDYLCPIGSLVLTVCFTVQLAPGKWQARVGAKIAWGLGKLRANDLGQEAQGGAANSILAQASVRVHRVEARGGEGQSIKTSGWPCSKSDRKN